jgi:hypothetical protein
MALAVRQNRRDAADRPDHARLGAKREHRPLVGDPA